MDLQNPSGTVNYNPLLAYSQQYGEHFRNHQDISPYYGFHLGSSVSPILQKMDLLSPAAKHAKLQFRKWIRAFRRLLRGQYRDKLRIRFIVSDAVSFAIGLERLRSGRGPSNIYSRPWSGESLCLDNGKSGNEDDRLPTAFNVIETGYVVDRVGFLNLAPSIIPLLKSPVSVLYTSTNQIFPETETRLLEQLLCGDVGIMCTLLGIVPIPYISGMTTRGHFQDNPQSKHPWRRIDNRITWKLATSDSPMADVAYARPHFGCDQLSSFLVELYCQMFPCEFPENFDLSGGDVTGAMCYTKKTFTALLKFFEGRVFNGINGSDWASLLKDVMEQIVARFSLKDQTDLLQEFTLQWQLHHLLTHKGRMLVEEPIDEASASSYRPGHGFLKNQTLPLICGLVITLPSATFREIKKVLLEKRIIINFMVLLKYPDQSSDKYLSVQPVFGKLHESVDGQTGTIEEDLQGCYGSADLHLCLHIASLSCVSHDPRRVRVAVQLMQEKVVYECFSPHFGNNLEIFKGKLLDPSVHIFESLPGLVPPRSSWTIPEYPSFAAKTGIFTLHFPKVDIPRRKFAQLIDLDGIKESNMPITVKQNSSCTVLVTCGNSRQICTFPFPIANVRHKLLDSSIKITAALVTSSNRGTYLSEPFPLVRFSDSRFTSWNLPYINFNKLDKIEGDIWKFDWINSLLLGMFSDREMRFRGTKSDLITNVKNTIHNMFTQLEYMVIRLKPENYNAQAYSSDLPIIFFITKIYFEPNSHSVVSEAYVLPITRDIKIFELVKGTDVTVSEEQMTFWRRALPAMAERCRDWTHKPTCEYRSSIPVSIKKGEKSICSCGMGKVGRDFDKVFPNAPCRSLVTRVAISPLFAAAFVENTRTYMNAIVGGTMDSLDVFHYPGAITDNLDLTNPHEKFRCKVCGKGNAKKCSKCLLTRYCSRECQVRDWNVHKCYCARAT